MTVILYSRPGCHLCEEAAVLLHQAGRRLALHIETINIDSDPELSARYGERIPVVLIAGNELAWPFTLAQARAALAGGG